MRIAYENAVSPSLALLWADMSHPQPVNAVAGKAVTVVLRAHFLEKNSQPNKNNWPKQNKWAQIRTATALDHADDTEAVVRVSDPAFNLKVYGGPIVPKRVRLLAIPASAAAYAAGSPGEGATPALRVLFAGRRPVGLGEVEGPKSISESIAAGKFWYWLVKSTMVPKDPEAMPPDSTIYFAIGDAVQSWFTRRYQQGAN